MSNLDLNHFLGAEGVTRLLSYLSDGPVAGNPGHARIESLDEFVDLFRRVQTPYYE